MTDFRDLLRERASETVAGAAYNDLRRRREENAEAPDRARYYEVLVSPSASWEAFRENTYPPFARWLRSQKIDPVAPRGVVVATFLGDRCHLLDGARFLDVLAKMEGLNGAALQFRVAQWVR
jgi:hypothetical protein